MLSEHAQMQAAAPLVADPQLDRNIKAMHKRFWKKHQEEMRKRQESGQYSKKPKVPYRGPEVKLQCGHWVQEPDFVQGMRKQLLQCTKCGAQWRGWKVISNFKGQAKKDLYEAIKAGNRGRDRRARP